MNSREHFVKAFKNEVPIFVRVFKAVPPAEAAYRPHPKSTSAGDLVWMLAGELHDAEVLARKYEVSFELGAAPPVPEAIAAYEKNAAALEKALAAVDDAAWARPAKFLVGGNVAWEAPLGEMLWGFLFDAIHHRGQLSAYLRPMGAKVPSIYGPSGDDPGQ